MRAFRLILTTLLLALAGCGTPTTAQVVHLSQLHPLPTNALSGVIPLRVAVAAVISPKGTVESYQPLMDYLSAKLSRPVELVQRRTYAEVNDLVEKGYVDVAFVCTSAYIDGYARFGMELLAAPLVKGETVYYSVLIVPADSPAQSMADLRDKVFAFTDPMSTSGRMYPTLLVRELGSTPDQFFARTFFTYNHDDAIRAVAQKLADGAAVDSLVYDYALARDPDLARQTRIIQRSPSLGIPPVVVNPGLRPQLKAELRNALLGISSATPDGQRALLALGVDGFVAIDDGAYASVRALLTQAGAVSP
ncbi:MAG: phosphate/phosphite/phosphonate ABC transporter substrate-binding protein [Chloroflexi bacterium]|nr:phosphate/phosphite/phosphonate ABC transporter substrate-binding protein [Chloroflexota bacterium]MCL5276002.1 phosphate/phosphite/phosphonate ABC transporter substrate-binding protein [Chloroflexota bacterium]